MKSNQTTYPTWRVFDKVTGRLHLASTSNNYNTGKKLTNLKQATDTTSFGGSARSTGQPCADR